MVFFPKIIEKFTWLWDVWDLRVAVLLSLSFQILLILIASWRKRTGRIIVTLFIWSAYLLADWVATLAIGLIASGPSTCEKKSLNKDLSAFWASFLLGHLGGPHTITAFALEDNELWIRHLLQLFVHLVGIAYVFRQSLPNELWIPTTLVYLAGLIKYAERTRALYLASLSTMKTSTLPNPMAGSNYARLMQTYRSKYDASVPVDIILAETPEEKPPAYALDGGSSQVKFSEIDAVQSGYRFFNNFKGLIVDLTYGYRDWQKTREEFFRKTAKEAFRIMEVELNFLYDLLYTKVVVVHCKLGFIVKFVCLAFVVIALMLFAYHHQHHKHEIEEFDTYITYILLIGAIGLDVLGIIMLIFSDWTAAALANWKTTALKNCTTKLLSSYYAISKRISCEKDYRWSQSLSQHSLIIYCLKKRFILIDKLVNLFGAKDFFDEMKYKQKVFVKKNDGLKEFIFSELREKASEAKNAKAAKEMCSRRGEKIVLQTPRFYTSLAESVEVEYDESVLRWHVATELCYHTTVGKEDVNREYCKILSEYMLYLLIMRPTMISAVAGIVQIRFQDTCEEAKKFFQTKNESTIKFSELVKDCKRFFQTTQEPTRKFSELLKNCFSSGKAPPAKEGRSELSELSKACHELLSVDTVVPPHKVKGGTSKSVLFEACIMANDLLKLEGKERWEIMGKVWVELLSYAASHCRAYAHAQQLSKGGEFITFVWLLMIHFGMGEPFRVDPESRYKLVVGK